LPLIAASIITLAIVALAGEALKLHAA
jgi:hypothetical protein